MTFNDSGAANGAVNLNAVVQPGSVTLTMTNASSAYSFSGTGSIIGNTGLVMNGMGSLTVNTSNSYTGETDIHGGNLVINSGGALGDSSGQARRTSAGPAPAIRRRPPYTAAARSPALRLWLGMQPALAAA